MEKRLSPGDLFAMKWTDESPSMYLVLREEPHNSHYDNVDEQLVGRFLVSTSEGTTEVMAIYHFDFRDNVLEVVARV